jgi:hypothetical protein
MLVLAVDPGNVQSAWVLFEPIEFDAVVHDKLIENNDKFLLRLYDWGNNNSQHIDALVIEQIVGMGMAVGQEVFETVFWSGRFIEAWNGYGLRWERITRGNVKLHLCGSSRAKDKNVRQALLDRYGPPGVKKNPNRVTYKVYKDLWSALAVATTYCDIQAGRI